MMGLQLPKADYKLLKWENTLSGVCPWRQHWSAGGAWVTGWFKQEKFISHSPGGWEVEDQVAINLVSGESSSWLTDGHLLSVSSHSRKMERERALWCVFHKDINSVISGPHIYDPITFITIYGPCLQRHSCGGWGVWGRASTHVLGRIQRFSR